MPSTDTHPRVAITCADDRCDSWRVRRAIADHCGARLDPETIADAQLVASELVTNAFEHGERGVITVDVVVSAHGVTLTVTSSGNSRGMPHPVDWTMPDVPNRTGRGLALTRLVSSGVELHTADHSETGDWVAVTAHVTAKRAVDAA